MVKEFQILSIEGDLLRAARFAEEKGSLVQKDCASWSIVAEAKAADGASAGEGDADAEEGKAEISPLVEGFKKAASFFRSREIVLSVPLSKLLVTSLRVKKEELEDLSSQAQKAIAKISPFPDEEFAIGTEIVNETDLESDCIAVAFPAESANEIDDALAASKLLVTSTDSTAFGWLYTYWSRVIIDNGCRQRLVIIRQRGEWELFVIDNKAPVYARGLDDHSDKDLQRDIMLSLLKYAPLGIDEVVVLTKDALTPEQNSLFSSFGKLRIESLDDDFGAVTGVARRYAEGFSFDATPSFWKDDLDEARFKAKCRSALSVAGALWLVIALVIFGGPMVYDHFNENEKQLIKAHREEFRRVSDMRGKVNLVRKYSDHAHNSLEMLRMVSERLPEGITLSNFSYKHEESLQLAGEAEQANQIYKFKEKLQATKLFEDVRLTGPTVTRNGQRFSIDAKFPTEEGK